jgi:hypothetical protein
VEKGEWVVKEPNYDIKALRWMCAAQEDISKAEGGVRIDKLVSAKISVWHAYKLLEDAIELERTNKSGSMPMKLR